MNEQKMNVRDIRSGVFNSIGRLRRRIALISYLIDENSDAYIVARDCMDKLEYLGHMICEISFSEKDTDTLMEGLLSVWNMTKEIEELITNKFDSVKVLENLA